MANLTTVSLLLPKGVKTVRAKVVRVKVLNLEGQLPLLIVSFGEDLGVYGQRENYGHRKDTIGIRLRDFPKKISAGQQGVEVKKRKVVREKIESTISYGLLLRIIL